MFKKHPWQWWAGKFTIWAPAVVKVTLDTFEVTAPNAMTYVMAAVAIITTILGLIPAKAE